MADIDIELESYDGPEDVERPRDTKIDAAKATLLRDLFEAMPDEVFYQRQIEVRFERQFFHWITAKALNELAAEGKIGAETRQHPNIQMRVYWSRTNRYWRRQAKAIEKLVLRFSDSGFTRGLGQHGETMFDAALPQGGFMPAGKNVRVYNGRTWTQSSHDLDRVFTRDGLAYGIEIKNTLSYIPRDEMHLKMQMCAYLGLIPLFIVRAAPASYVQEVYKRGGLTLVFEWQLYPFGQEAFAREVREQLGLKVDCPRAIAEGTIQRLLSMHEGLIRRMAETQREDAGE